MTAWSLRAGCCGACWANSGICTECLWVELGCSVRRPSWLDASCNICTSDGVAVSLLVSPVGSMYSWWQLPFHSGWCSLKSWLLWNKGWSMLHFHPSWVAQSVDQLSGSWGRLLLSLLQFFGHSVPEKNCLFVGFSDGYLDERLTMCEYLLGILAKNFPANLQATLKNLS